MSNIKPESLKWLDDLAAITVQLKKTPNATHPELGKALNINTKLLAIEPFSDPAAVEKVPQAAKTNPPFILSSNSSKTLSGLKKAKAGDVMAFHDALEYFIRHSRLGHDAQPGGMPYPLQGLVLNGDGEVEKLWAGSPMDKAGVVLGDMIWSADKNPPDPVGRQKLEAILAALAPGAHDLYLVSPADRDKVRSDVNFNRAGSFNPKRRRVTLAVI